MAQDASPIDVGSTWEYKYEEEGEIPLTFEVVNIWIDEDDVAHVTIDYDSHRPDEKVTVEDMRERERDGRLERTNTGHEAWENRQE